MLLERCVGQSTNICSFCTLTKVLISALFTDHFLKLLSTHDTASENAISCFLTSIHNLGFVSLMTTLSWIISSCSNIDIRLSCPCNTHVVKHYLALSISASLLVKSGLVNTSTHLRGTTCKIAVLNLSSSHVRRILSSVCTLSSLNWS